MKCHLSMLPCNECLCIEFCNNEVKANVSTLFYEGFLNSSLNSVYSRDQLQVIMNDVYELLTDCEKEFGYSDKKTNRVRDVWKKLDDIWCERYNDEYFIIK